MSSSSKPYASGMPSMQSAQDLDQRAILHDSADAMPPTQAWVGPVESGSSASDAERRSRWLARGTRQPVRTQEPCTCSAPARQRWARSMWHFAHSLVATQTSSISRSAAGLTMRWSLNRTSWVRSMPSPLGSSGGERVHNFLLRRDDAVGGGLVETQRVGFSPSISRCSQSARRAWAWPQAKP